MKEQLIVIGADGLAKQALPKPIIQGFDLEIALKQPECVVYGSGEKPKEWYYNKRSGDKFPIITTRENGDVLTYTTEGKFFSNGYLSPLDLMLYFSFDSENNKSETNRPNND